MKKKEYRRQFIIAIIAILIIAIINGCQKPPSSFQINIEPLNSGQHIAIDRKNIQGTPNKDGVLFVHVSGLTKEYDGNISIQVQPVDVPDWFEQDDATRSNGKFVARIQLGSVEWPIRGGERYTLKVSAGSDSALAQISVNRSSK